MASKKLFGRLHAHGCRDCHTRYEDACIAPDQDGRCTACRGGRPWQLLIENARPKTCCIDQSRLASKDDRATYRLAGTHLWWICTSCKRTHPYDPKTDQRNRKDDA